MVQLSALISLLGEVLCQSCKSPIVQFELSTGNAIGFSMKGWLFCTTCLYEDYLCQRILGAKSTRAPFEINSRSTMAFRGIWCGFSAINECCGVMNMPYSMSQDAYTAHHKKFTKQALRCQKLCKVTLINQSEYKDII